ncbi:MAG: glycosyltransferase [Cyanobacteria bacterium]|nr:glycosyltransferase [Cyanobacteriota bacterium]
MRIAYLTGEYPRATDTFIQREIAILRDRGLEVRPFSIRRTGAEHDVSPEIAAERQRTFCILPAAKNPLRLIGDHLTLLLQNPARYLRAIALAFRSSQPGLKGGLYQFFYFLEAGIVAREMARSRLSHVHNHFGSSSGTVALLAAELGGYGFSMSLHGPYIFFEPDRWRLDLKVRKALFVACISYFCRSQVAIYTPPDRWDRLHIIHCGVNPDLFEPVDHQGPGRNLLYCGRLAAVKGLPILLESLAQLRDALPDVRLNLIGDGPDRPLLERMVQDLGLGDRVHFLGYRSQDEVRAALQQTDIFVLPSFAEGVPVSLMEAMAAGVPVVTTHIAGVAELVEDGVSGYLVPPSNVEQLGDRLKTLLLDGDLRRRFGAAGRAKVAAEFDIRQEGDRLHQIFANALDGKPSPIRP